MRDLLRILLPPLVWLASFSAIYGLHGWGCALGWPEVAVSGGSLFRVVLLAAWGTAILAQIALLVAWRRYRHQTGSAFTRWTSLATAWVGLGAVLWTLFPLAVMAEC